MEIDIEFPLVSLSLLNYATPSVNIPISYNLYGVTKYNGTQDAIHYTSLCRSEDGDNWYKCDDQNMKIRISGKFYLNIIL